MISIDDARARVLSQLVPAPAQRVPLNEALGLVLAEPLRATEDVPPFVNTAVDGYAVRAVDTTDAPIELTVVGSLGAGAAWPTPIGSGQALRIMTGAPMPAGADAVVMVEDTVSIDGGARVRVGRSVARGDAVRAAGSDVEVGTLVLEVDTVLRPAHIGVAAMINQRTVLVHPRLRVGVLSTGDELIDDDSALAPGQIRESNRTMLVAAVTAAGATPVDLGIARDNRADIMAALDRAVMTCDAIITSGGVSMGEFDLIKTLLQERAEMNWMQLAIKPAKPFAFGLLPGPNGPVPIFGLPGNPVSSLVSFELIARPGLRHLMGHRQLDRPMVRAVCDAELSRHPDGKVHFLRVNGVFAADGRFHVLPVRAQGSHQLAATATANALARVPDGGSIPAGGEVDALLLFAE